MEGEHSEEGSGGELGRKGTRPSQDAVSVIYCADPVWGGAREGGGLGWIGEQLLLLLLLHLLRLVGVAVEVLQAQGGLPDPLLLGVHGAVLPWIRGSLGSMVLEGAQGPVPRTAP